MRWIIRVLVMFFLIIAGCITFLLTPTGLQASIYIATKFLPGTLTIHRISGVIIGPISIDQLRYQEKNEEISIQKLTFNWKPADLLKKQFTITRLSIQNAKWHIAHKTSKKTNINTLKHQLIESLGVITKLSMIPVVIQQAHLQQLVITESDQKTVLDVSQMIINRQWLDNAWQTNWNVIIQKPVPLHWYFYMKAVQHQIDFTLLTVGKETNWMIQGEQKNNRLIIQTKKNLFLQGQLNISFEYNPKFNPQWSGELNAKQIHLSLLYAELPNIISFDVRSNGSNTDTPLFDTKAVLKLSNSEIQLQILHSVDWNIQLIAHDNDSNHFAMMLSGTLKKHQINTAIHYHDQDVVFAAQGDLDLSQWNGNVIKLQLFTKNKQSWMLLNNATLQITADSITTTPICVISSDHGRFCLSGNWFRQSPWHISLRGEFPLLLLSDLIPSDIIRLMDGRLITHVDINGYRNKPVVSGTLNLQQGSLLIPFFNLTLSNVSMNVSGELKQLVFHATAFSQNKPYIISGITNLLSDDLQTQINIHSDNALLINTDEYIVYVSANLKAVLNTDSLLLSGQLFVPTATIQPNDFHLTTTLPIEDIIYIGEKQKKQRDFIIQTDIIVSLGDQVAVDLSGLKANIGGKLHLMGQTNQETFATGDITVRKGSYSIYGQTLSIEPGSYISYSHSLLNNPNLNIRASKTIPTISAIGGSTLLDQNKLNVGIELQGTLSAIRSSFFSNRSDLSQADILSYLILGYANNTNTPGNTDFLLRALSALDISNHGLLGKQNIAAQIQKGLGLSELGVESETNIDALGNPLNQQSSFVFGKHVTENLYARYSIGLLGAVNVFQLRYLFWKSWALQTDSSSLGNGFDLLYTIERD